MFTATLALKLIEEGYFDLEDTIVKWFPNVVNSETITIRTLLNHTSGIYNYTENFPFQCKVLLSPKKKCGLEKSFINISSRDNQLLNQEKNTGTQILIMYY